MSWATRISLVPGLLLAAATLAGIALLLGIYPADSASRLDEVRLRGELVVAVQEGPASYFEDGFGPGGFEYSLADAFARELGVKLAVRTVANEQEGLDLVAEGAADIAVGQALESVAVDSRFATSVPVRATGQMVVCPAAAPEGAASLSDVVPGQGAVLAPSGSHRAIAVAAQAKADPELSWQAIDEATDDQLLARISKSGRDCVAMDSDAWAFHRHLYPGLVVAAEFDQPVLFGWVQASGGDPGLRRAANDFLSRKQADGSLTALRDRHFAHVKTLTSDDSKRFMQAIRDTLPRYTRHFRQEAERNGLDWRLVAAVAYQESHWNPDATSPTGVQGLMQLTINTALDLGILDRTDPVASIRGGARYLRQTIDSLPADVPEQDRVWMALAAYNAGLAHVIDARALTRKRGGNPDSWPDVRSNLALLKDPKWYSKTQYGYARGATQSIIFVRHVRRYYDLLVLASNTHGDRSIRLAMNTTTRAGAH